MTEEVLGWRPVADPRNTGGKGNCGCGGVGVAMNDLSNFKGTNRLRALRHKVKKTSSVSDIVCQARRLIFDPLSRVARWSANCSTALGVKIIRAPAARQGAGLDRRKRKSSIIDELFTPVVSSLSISLWTGRPSHAPLKTEDRCHCGGRASPAARWRGV